MAIRSTRQVREGLTVFVLAASVALLGDAAYGKSSGDRACAETAAAQLAACNAEATDDFFAAEAICINGEEAEADTCTADARVGRREARLECREQHAAREDLCEELGGGRYAPDFTPANFDDDFTSLTNPNPYFPLGIGYEWELVGGDETITIEVLAKTKLIEGVTCIVVNDRVEIGGKVAEDTDDWFGQRKSGTVDYCGEISRDFEFFEGDDPEEAELVEIDGSWKAGRDGALPGTLFRGSPMVGDVYRQEWSPGDAEDAARVLSTSYGYGNDAVLDAFVPQGLAELLCSDDCVVTGEFSPLDPDTLEHKYYAQGVGLFLEVHPDSGEIVQLVDCNVSPKCNSLPTP